MKKLKVLFKLLFVASALAACGNNAGPVKQEDVQYFAQKAGLGVPNSAVATNFKRVFSMDGMMLLRLEVPSKDLPDFLVGSGLDGELIRTTDRAANEAIFGEFLKANPEKFRAGQKSLGDGFFLDVLIDDDNEDTKVAYLLWFGT